MPKVQVNPRKKMLDSISAKIAMFLITETYVEELDAREHLSKAVEHLDQAVAILVSNDEKSSIPK